VRFLDWYESHAALFDSFKDYRGVVLPSIEDANGIVIQEAMALGLPAICLNWGGPQLLVDHEINGYLISPKSKDFILEELARCMDRLGENGALAESFSISGREKAEIWRWSRIAETWMNNYPDKSTAKQ
jgi:glycosyltransferase involved in cell wall biosynthesis